jgi:hypothetical protein
LIGKTLDYFEESLATNYKEAKEMEEQLHEVQRTMLNHSDHL